MLLMQHCQNARRLFAQATDFTKSDKMLQHAQILTSILGISITIRQGLSTTRHDLNMEFAPQPAEFYNTDCGSKMSMATALKENPNRMAIMKSGTRRFQSRPRHLVTPFGTYQLDAAHKKSLSSQVRDSKLFYAAPFYAKTRCTSVCETLPTGLECSYDVKALTCGQPPSFKDSVDQSPIRYTVMRSKLARIAKPASTAAPDIVYDTDTMQKQCMVTMVQNSPMLYAHMSRSKVQRSGMLTVSSSPAEIGPGSYNCPIRSDVRTSLVLNQNPLSSMLSRASRLSAEKVDPTKNLGSTWKQERDSKYWNRGQTIAKSARQL